MTCSTRCATASTPRNSPWNSRCWRPSARPCRTASPVLLGHDDPGLLGVVRVRPQGPQHHALRAGRGRPRLRLPGRPRRGGGRPHPPGPRGLGRRRRAVLDRRAGHGPAVRPERHLADRRRRRLRHPARVHDGRLRRADGDGADPPGLRGPGGVLRGPGGAHDPGDPRGGPGQVPRRARPVGGGAPGGPADVRADAR